MTSPPPILPPLRSLDLDLASFSNPSAASGRPGSAMDISNPNDLPPVVPGLVPSLPNTLPPRPPPVQAGNAPNAEGPNYEDQSEEEGQEDDQDDLDEHSDEDEDNDIDVDPYPWRPIVEDTSIPCADEQAFIDSKEEHSAKDHAYWEQVAFFDPDDPEIKPREHGRIEWTVTAFNGTQENPNKQLVMTSQIVRIGEHDWRIKMYPKGDRTDFISVYVECLTMSTLELEDDDPFTNLPLPVFVGATAPKRRYSVAAQVAVVMYNPAEPRVYEHRNDAHQFHLSSPDFGWKYFSRDSRYEFHLRNHGQRQSIFRNDQLAFTAYIRIVDDPTGCLWEVNPPKEGGASPTSLVSFDGASPRLATYMLLFHLPPFRRWLTGLKIPSHPIMFIQAALIKFLSRQLKRGHLRQHNIPSGGDVVAVLHGLRAVLAKEASAKAVEDFDAIFGSLDANDAPVSHNRLLTSGSSTIQHAIDARGDKGATPAVLTIELERQRFDRRKRKWEKINNPVLLNDEIIYGGEGYDLYAFVTHIGPLGSTNFVPHIRPGGPGQLWYAYDSKHVKALTQKAAEDRQRGIKSTVELPVRDDNPYSGTSAAKREDNGIAYLAMYVRQDRSPDVFSCPSEDTWQLAEKMLKKHVPGNGCGATEQSHGRTLQPAIKYATPNEPRVLSPDLVDGDDIVMSDGEESIPIPSFNRPVPGVEGRLYEERLNYFSGPYYKGTILADGKYHGHGQLIGTNGDVYDGDFYHGKPQGKGTMTYAATGDKYIGEWQDGQHHGQGKFFESANGNVFEGGWKKGRRHGRFVLSGEVTEDDKQYCQICYEREMNIAFYDCGHVLACKPCANSVQQCPVCRKQVLGRLELFGVKVSMQ